MGKKKSIIDKMQKKEVPYEVKALRILRVFMLMIIVLLLGIVIGAMLKINSIIVAAVILVIEAGIYMYGRSLRLK